MTKMSWLLNLVKILESNTEFALKSKSEFYGLSIVYQFKQYLKVNTVDFLYKMCRKETTRSSPY